MGDLDLAVQRRRQDFLRDSVDRAQSDISRPGRRYVGQAYNGGAMPSTVPSVYLTRPVGLAVSAESEGTVIGMGANGLASVPVAVIGPAAPTVGSILLCDLIDGLWVAEWDTPGGGGGNPFSGCGGCTGQPGTSGYWPNTLTLVDPAGSLTLTYTPNAVFLSCFGSGFAPAWVGCRSASVTGYTTPPCHPSFQTGCPQINGVSGTVTIPICYRLYCGACQGATYVVLSAQWPSQLSNVAYIADPANQRCPIAAPVTCSPTSNPCIQPYPGWADPFTGAACSGYHDSGTSVQISSCLPVNLSFRMDNLFPMGGGTTITVTG